MLPVGGGTCPVLRAKITLAHESPAVAQKCTLWLVVHRQVAMLSSPKWN
jgi:hypothetical protein